MSEEVTALLLEMIKKQGEDIKHLSKKVNELIEFKNKLVWLGVLLSAIFGFIWDWFKNMFSRVN